MCDIFLGIGFITLHRTTCAQKMENFTVICTEEIVSTQLAGMNMKKH